MPADPLVVIQEIPAAVEDQAVPVDLERLGVMGRMAVDHVDASLDQPVGEVALLGGDIVAPVAAPMD